MNWKDELRHTTGILRPMRAEQADTAKGFHALHEAALAPGAMATKEKELIALAIAFPSNAPIASAFISRLQFTQAPAATRSPKRSMSAC